MFYMERFTTSHTNLGWIATFYSRFKETQDLAYYVPSSCFGIRSSRLLSPNAAVSLTAGLLYYDRDSPYPGFCLLSGTIAHSDYFYMRLGEVRNLLRPKEGSCRTPPTLCLPKTVQWSQCGSPCEPTRRANATPPIGPRALWPRKPTGRVPFAPPIFS